MKDNNTNNELNELRKQIKEIQKEGKRILKLLKLSRTSYKSQHIINGYLINEIITVMEKMFDWYKEDEENADKIKRNLIYYEESEKDLQRQWKKVKDFLENLWHKKN